MFSIIHNSQVALIIGVCSSLFDSSCNSFGLAQLMTELMIKKFTANQPKTLLETGKETVLEKAWEVPCFLIITGMIIVLNKV